MNEFRQQGFNAVGMTSNSTWSSEARCWSLVRNAPTAPQSHGDDGINISLSYTDPFVYVPLLRDR